MFQQKVNMNTPLVADVTFNGDEMIDKVVGKVRNICVRHVIVHTGTQNNLELPISMITVQLAY